MSSRILREDVEITLCIHNTQHSQENMMTTHKPYTYLIGWSSLNKYYYGVRFSADCDPSDLWSSYFTSSSIVKEYVDLHGNPDVIEIRRTFIDSMEARIWENKVLKRLNVKKSDKWLNLTDNMAMPSPADLPIHIEKIRREKISQSHKLNPRSGGMTGKSHDIETKKQMSMARKSYWDNIDGNSKENVSANMKQGWKNMSDDKKELWKQTQKAIYYSKPLISCPHCNKESRNRSAMSRWHFDNCKLHAV